MNINDLLQEKKICALILFIVYQVQKDVPPKYYCCIQVFTTLLHLEVL